jgi:cytoskeletal protein CcmA (bactofilin family)
MAEIRIKDIDEHEIDTILAEDIDFEGQLSFKKPLMIKGKFKGEIKSASSLYIGDKAYVEARIEANLISSKGRIKGDMLGHSRVELFSTAQLDGDITAPDFVVESGCKFNGYCNMGGGVARRDGAASQAASQAQAQSQGNAAGRVPDKGVGQPGGQPKPVTPQAGGNASQGANRT